MITMKYLTIIICAVLWLAWLSMYIQFQESNRYFENKEKQDAFYEDKFSKDTSIESLCLEYFYEYNLYSTTELIEHYSNAWQLYSRITETYGSFSVCDSYQGKVWESSSIQSENISEQTLENKCILNGVAYEKPDNAYCVTDSSVHAWYCNKWYYESWWKCIFGTRPVSATKQKQDVIYVQPLLLPQRGVPEWWKQEN